MKRGVFVVFAAVFLFSCILLAGELPSFFPPKNYSATNEWLPTLVQEGLLKLQHLQWNSVLRRKTEQALFFLGLSLLLGCSLLSACAFYFFPYEKWRSLRKERKRIKRGKELLFLMQKQMSASLSFESKQVRVWQMRALIQQWICWKLDLHTFSLTPSQVAHISKSLLSEKERKLVQVLLEEMEVIVFSKEKAGRQETFAFIDKKFSCLVQEIHNTFSKNSSSLP